MKCEIIMPNKERKYKIYTHINKINGKIYIGQTCRKNIKDRFGKNGNRYFQCPIFGQAIKKYGWNNFTYLILENNLNENDVDYKERFYIKLFHSTDRKYGYNVEFGGSLRKNISLKTRKKISNSLKGNVPWNKGLSWNNDVKEKISIAKKGKSCKNTRIWTLEERKKQSERLKGHKMSKEAIQKLKQYVGEKAIWYGRHHSEETKEKLRQYCGEKASFYGKKHTQEYKDYMSKKVSGKNNQAYGKHWFTNGKENYFGFICPDGFYKGVTKNLRKFPKLADRIVGEYKETL